jgi:hypothetical protein
VSRFKTLVDLHATNEEPVPIHKFIRYWTKKGSDIEWKQIPDDRLSFSLELLLADGESPTYPRLLVERRKLDGTWPRGKNWRDFAIGDVIDACDSVHKW